MVLQDIPLCHKDICLYIFLVYVLLLAQCSIHIIYKCYFIYLSDNTV